MTMTAWAPGLPDGATLCSPWKRLGGNLLDGVVMAVTLVVGWFVWSVVVWGRGQSPGKQLLGMTVIVERTRRPARRGRMFFREVVAKTLIGFLPTFVLLAAPKDDSSALLYALAA